MLHFLLIYTIYENGSQIFPVLKQKISTYLFRNLQVTNLKFYDNNTHFVEYI